jgi:seryl-tRNA synthetase
MLQQEDSLRSRKELRKYVEGINEKDVEINSLKRQQHSLKNRISSLEQEVSNLANIKENYEIFVLKAVDQLKTSLKEVNSYVEDMEN